VKSNKKIRPDALMILSRLIGLLTKNLLGCL